ncbi:hypothetical protein K0504_09740 [Neiella marina]|uniref:Uncharacterized protein n=1 Tax=Neiella holothuriorum TaxID=2870530 RepID=A0ABS7EHE6_9GAMM|nr:hypothetical protein [Neiella holothuriorum]MBW8191318.1 hypothetical protein [Neiella holothuriorum]
MPERQIKKSARLAGVAACLAASAVVVLGCSTTPKEAESVIELPIKHMAAGVFGQGVGSIAHQVSIEPY